jgi:hypothetical protein
VECVVGQAQSWEELQELVKDQKKAKSNPKKSEAANNTKQGSDGLGATSPPVPTEEFHTSWKAQQKMVFLDTVITDFSNCAETLQKQWRATALEGGDLLPNYNYGSSGARGATRQQAGYVRPPVKVEDHIAHWQTNIVEKALLRMGAEYGFFELAENGRPEGRGATCSNVEVWYRWLMLCIRCKWEDCTQLKDAAEQPCAWGLDAFFGEHGRGSYVKPNSQTNRQQSDKGALGV